ncbi:TetR family transcriptional regulator [Streptomyces sp. 3MP-14]|uniref:TetR family transcriptional regulator n=1 Tax=Streptomyces mimosae TaxID=2586635 RepID=A0A5N6ACD6_9ACTN|nr:MULTISPECIES: TetR/AcrR family transcriptional regulator [Streptomyces]KAB8166477.1 TetR family transcriptional regulator [Streptomyces mimosae]KAB8178906.1 TetR family transcriptional regulator [Streptomyces sp. 3MP-14]
MTADGAGERSPIGLGEPDGPVEPDGLRERRWRRVHERLLDTGLELFLAHGYEATTVQGIARGAEVSERTFFRHLPSKEDVVLEPLRRLHGFFRDEVDRRPTSEGPLLSLRRAMVAALRSAPEPQRQLGLRALRVVGRDERARALCLRLYAEQQSEIAEVVRAHRGLPPDDPRPALLAGAFASASLVATERWSREGDGTARSLERVGESHYALLHAALGNDRNSSVTTTGSPDAGHQRRPRPKS